MRGYHPIWWALTWRSALLLMVGMLAVLTMSSCVATTRQGQLKEIGYYSKVGATTLYRAIFTAHLQGYVPDAEMQQAQLAYDVGREAQRLYVDAVEAGLSNSDTLLMAVQVALDNLQRIAMQYQLTIPGEAP